TPDWREWLDAVEAGGIALDGGPALASIYLAQERRHGRSWCSAGHRLSGALVAIDHGHVAEGLGAGAA
ncbi:hypothetical protein CATMIT_01839, partial [Catenibacterium mitsuokai DSM 15897]